MILLLDNLSSALPNTDLLRHKKHRQMDRLRRTLSFRNRKKEKITNNNNNNTKTVNKPLQWHEDEKSVRTSTCNYNVKVKEKEIYVNFVQEKKLSF